jgi:hypothetical protein
LVKINYEEREDEISKKLSDYGKQGWELVNFQSSSESRGLLRSVIALTTCYVLIFRREIKGEKK